MTRRAAEIAFVIVEQRLGPARHRFMPMSRRGSHAGYRSRDSRRRGVARPPGGL